MRRRNYKRRSYGRSVGRKRRSYGRRSTRRISRYGASRGGIRL